MRDPTWGQMDEEIRHGRWTKQIVDTMNTRDIENPDVERARCLETLLQLGPVFVPIVVTRNRDRVKFNNHMIALAVACKDADSKCEFLPPINSLFLKTKYCGLQAS